MEEGGQRVTKLVLTLSLLTNMLQELLHRVEVEAMLYDPAWLHVLSSTAKHEYKFKPKSDQMTMVLDLANQEVVDERGRAAGGSLEVIIRMKVNGYCLQSGFEKWPYTSKKKKKKKTTHRQ